MCFVAVLILGALLRFVISKLVEGTGLSGTDRLLGMLFGFARGVLLVTLLVFLVGFTAFTRDPWWQQSVLLPQFQRVAVWLEQRVPASVGRAFPSGGGDRSPACLARRHCRPPYRARNPPGRPAPARPAATSSAAGTLHRIP